MNINKADDKRGKRVIHLSPCTPSAAPGKRDQYLSFIARSHWFPYQVPLLVAALILISELFLYPNYLDFCARGWWLFSLTCNNSHHCVKLPKRWKTACCTFSPFDKEAWDIIAMEYQTQIYFCLFNWLWVACMHIYSYLCGSGFVFVCICPYAVRFSYLWRKWPWKLVQLVYASWIANREEWLLI